MTRRAPGLPYSKLEDAHAGSLKSLNLEACPIRRLPAQLSGAQLSSMHPTHAMLPCLLLAGRGPASDSCSLVGGPTQRGWLFICESCCSKRWLATTCCQHVPAGASKLEDLRLGGTLVAIHGTSTAMLRLLGALPRLRQVAAPQICDPVSLQATAAARASVSIATASAVCRNKRLGPYPCSTTSACQIC